VRGRLRCFGLAAVVAVVVIGTVPAASAALTERAERSATFEGAGCGSEYAQRLSLPGSAKAPVRAVSPQVGEELDQDPRDDFVVRVAAITAVEVTGTSHVTWTATSRPEDAPCAFPSLYQGWSVSTDLVAEYKVRVYFPSKCLNAKQKPKRIIVACGDGNFQLKSLRWHGWNKKKAKARGKALINDCKPDCARGTFHTYPARAQVSKPYFCREERRYLYRRLKVRSRGRSFKVNFGFACGDPF
jgi:hypothetical protein